jgi:small conductance mechanosensitive channel
MFPFQFLNEVVADSTATKGLADALNSVTGMSAEEIKQAVSGFTVDVLIKIVQVLLIWFVGRWIIKRIVNVIKRVMDKKLVNDSVKSFVTSLIDVVVMILLIIMIISVLGVDTSSFIAIFASAGVAIGMALSGTLQNFAGGVMILLFRPFKVGDYIEAQGMAGTVKEIQIFNTVITTPDNKVIMLPNGPVSTGIINNYSREPKRRLDMTFSISYGNDFEKAKTVLQRIIAEDTRILNDPAEPFIVLGEMGASSIDIIVRVWCNQGDYWGIKFDLNKKVYETFPKEGLEFPFQTLTLHVEKEA